MSTIDDNRLLAMLDAEAVCLVLPNAAVRRSLRDALDHCHQLATAGRPPTSIHIVDQVIIQPDQISRLWRRMPLATH